MKKTTAPQSRAPRRGAVRGRVEGRVGDVLLAVKAMRRDLIAAAATGKLTKEDETMQVPKCYLMEALFSQMA